MGAMLGAGGLNIPFLDGGNSLVPTVGFYGPSGSWIVEGHGVPADVELLDDPAAMADGSDPQLDAAIKFIMSEVSSRPQKRIVRPPFGRSESPAFPK